MIKILASVLTIIMIVVFSFKTFSLENRLTGTWGLDVHNLNKTLITALKIKFTTVKADSCLGGSWRKIEVISSTPEKNSFYPDNSMILHQELSYKLESDILTIGRNNICDAYKHLTGKLVEDKANGTYISFGWSREELGSFKLHRESS
jgi:hypothetical protein